MENEITQTSSQTQTGSLSPPNGMAPSPGNHGNPTSAPRYGTVIPNRIFVGGIDFKTNENDLRKFFSHYGVVNEVKIVNDRAGVSKGYGFVTFETQDDAQKILQEADKLFFRDKKLNVGPAIRKQQVGIPYVGFPFSGSSPSVTPPAQATMYFTTSTGYPYTYHNGVAYFHAPEITSVPQHWPPCSISSSPVMVTQQAQPMLQQPACHYQSPAPAVPVLYMQASDILYQTQELPQDGGCAPSTLPMLEATVPESPAPAMPLLYMQASDILYQTQELPQDGGCAPSTLPMLEATVPELKHDAVCFVVQLKRNAVCFVVQLKGDAVCFVVQLQRDTVCFVVHLKHDAVCFVVQLKHDAVCFVVQLKRDAVYFVMQLKRDTVCFVMQLKSDAVCFVVQLKRDAVCFVMQLKHDTVFCDAAEA
ncbi:UNVERIFIED_CONTAM: hypothetical protein FKN15_036589 [Acipenser sinensis]